MIDFAFFLEIIPVLLAGLPLTLQLTAASMGIGFLMALLLALAQQGNRRIVVWPIRAFVAVFRGTPLLVQIFLIYYGLGQFRPSLQAIGIWWLFREPYWCAIIALSLNEAAYGSEILRGAIKAVPRGLTEAATASGMSKLLTLRLIVLPLALRQAIPNYSNEIILMVKGTSLASIITLMEVTGIAQGLISQTYRAVEVFVAAGAIYLTLNFTIISALNALEIRLTPYRARA
ncbi:MULTISPECIES: ABC transporter permease [unclassified Mesorhizobium]|uniref:ABC transporter permease n=1 Tax=unclassified Mesorhizobium TaxID=325217 RepID=UPI000F761E22|nr:MULTISPECIES: ABC transporter permease [unclassified Mesorhizobium]AZO20555.1 ABC transporter permease [Mesorhizobium sp. M1E.F.Ca.ET.045.02.1.1]RUW37273.1 ABC transporter permease subunit [Mesorhizobium sp. M1E.F.Ca.ET.041.01.1.1]RUW85283.1 ABC transporter permease subunit [Mesorhizobium sp. M1E.F.Ca.ET.063.01.1.1]RWD87543.1 MAG: ABC transporter permease subunit [Mesorhizobium sp.]RWD87722.1 MAG: ABC transporter permease subunit [Mesorhizobium sp.]